ncbi:beta-fructosidase [Corynebacterium phocae]|uniref:beta-fructofuranosidase n=1 Tax=Corynebacterium phocae TaxID=161895 RepID=A0A1L7D414_9CORY|nr:GH32 C-terminal domain-containing protein [Corynebacterium phocae]APT92813.1 beta-fructosidase [Corynebacterium phocae]KAA8723129.1 glycoside hydrolase family 32 protein [Corynebacterium phocae]
MTLRPELHLLPESGILQAPAGVLFEEDVWHVFYQYKPDANQPARWGHSYSEEDPFYWLECDDVLAPVGGEVELRAGAVAHGSDGTNLYFTSVTNSDSAIALAKLENTDTCEVSDDPGALDPSVVRVDRVIKQTQDHQRFRSPCVVPDWADGNREEDHEGWLMLALSGTSDHPTPVIFRSLDGEDWQFHGDLTFKGETGLGEDLPRLVAPRILRLCDNVSKEIFDILCVTIEGEHGEYAGYFVGQLHGTEFEICKSFRRLDFGHDFTRPRGTTVTHTGKWSPEHYRKASLISLLNGRGRTDNPLLHHTWTEEGWANVLSLPREITLHDGVLYQTPPKHLPRAVEDSQHARMWTGLINVSEGASLTVSLLDGNGDVAATVTHSGNKLEFDRSPTKAFSNTYASEKPAVADIAEGEENSLTIIVDGSTVEIFADSGLVAMASRMYFTNRCSGFQVETCDGAEVIQSFECSGAQAS